MGLRAGLDHRAVWYQVPDFAHVHVAHGDAAVRPVQGVEQGFRVFLSVRRSVDHDHATGIDTLSARTGRVADVRVGDVHCQVEAIADLAPVHPIETFWRAFVTLHQFWALGMLAQGYAIGLERLAIIDQLQLVSGFQDQNFFDDSAIQGFRNGSL